MAAARELTSFWDLSAAATAAKERGEIPTEIIAELSDLAVSCQMDSLRDTICIYLSRAHGVYVYPFKEAAAIEVAATA